MDLNMSTKTDFDGLKRILFPQFEEIVIEYSGGGDSGDLEISQTLEIPSYILETPFKISETSYTSTVKEALIAVVDRALDEKFGGWENDEGGYGEVVFNFKDNLIHIKHNQYVQITEHHSAKLEM